MADYDIIPCYDEDELFQEKGENVNDLHAYYMSQFNLELENGKCKMKDNFKYGVEESFDFEVLDSWNGAGEKTDFEMIDEVLDANVDDENIKEVLLDLDGIEFDGNCKPESTGKSKEAEMNSNDYIDDESLIDELCREDGECLSPEAFNEDYLNTIANENLLPSIETAFSKRYCNYSTEECNPQEYAETTQIQNNPPIVNSLEHYSYPNNILYNLDNDKRYTLPDTPTSCTEFSFDRGERKASISESIGSDVQSSCYYDDNSQNFDEDELFINLDDFGLTFEKEESYDSTDGGNSNRNERNLEKERNQGIIINI